MNRYEKIIKLVLDDLGGVYHSPPYYKVISVYGLKPHEITSVLATVFEENVRHELKDGMFNVYNKRGNLIYSEGENDHLWKILHYGKYGKYTHTTYCPEYQRVHFNYRDIMGRTLY
jgi:hypothetical protein